jgi:exportin-7
MDQSQLSQVEALCNALYVGTSSEQRAEAQQQLLTLQSTADFIPQCQFILDNSTLPYAQLVASSSLENLVTQFWNNFSQEQKMEIRNYVLNYLASHAHSLQDFVVGNMTKLISRITKLGWFDSQEHRDIIDEIHKFLEATIDHTLIGLKLLKSLVDEMNTPIVGRTLTLHRKTAVSFRDQTLLQIFQVAITSLRKLQSSSKGQMSQLPDKDQKVANLAVSVATECLSFDFIGTNPEESAEDVGTVQVPSSWRPILQDTTTIQLFFDFYMSSEPPRSSLALQALLQISSVRRSLFQSEKERTAFLQALMSGIQSVMQTKKGLEHVDNYHEFCSLLGRLKASYQLSELVKTQGFGEWLELAGDFTIKSLQNWEYSMNSIHYLLALWGRLVAALPYLRADTPEAQRPSQSLRSCVLQVVESYIKTMLDSVDVVVASDGGVDDPLEDEGSLREQMDRLPVIARLQYETVAQFLLLQFEQALAIYEPVIQMTVNGFKVEGQDAIKMKVVEGRMTWLTYMVAAVIDTQAANDPRKGQGELIWDGRLSRCVFTLLQLIDFRLANSNGQGKCDIKLEIAILHYFKSFKKIYLMDSVGGGGMGPSSMGVGGMTYTPGSMVPGGSPAHPLLSYALSYTGGPGRSGADDKAEGGSAEIVTVYDAMGLGDVMQIMNIIVNKLCNNIKYWHRSDKILEETLEVFVELISSYSSSKALLSLETVNFLVHNHVGAHFPFLGFDNDNKYRVTFYSAMGRLVFTSSEDMNNSFDSFVAPNLEIMVQLSSTSDLRTPAVKTAIVAALRDWRGLTVSAYSKRTYNLLFECLYPASFSLLLRVAETWYDDPTVMTALFKFMQEFVLNKGQRIFFENSSANGILLFRETSSIISAYGSRILQVPVQKDIYLEKYKGIRLMLNTLTNALSGNYVNFGVFNLYNDQALQNALDVSLQMCLQIPLSDVMAYVKLSRAYFAFVEVLFRNHLDVLSGLDSSVFLNLIRTNQEGLQSSDLSVSAQCASTVDHIATYMFLNQSKDKPTVQSIRSHMASDPEVLHQLMSTLFNSLLFASHANHWAVTRPILSLLLASEASFTDYQNQLVVTQSTENQEKLKEEFTKLTADIQRSVDTANRDRFTQKLTIFRLNVRQFLTL